MTRWLLCCSSAMNDIPKSCVDERLLEFRRLHSWSSVISESPSEIDPPSFRKAPKFNRCGQSVEDLQLPLILD